MPASTALLMALAMPKSVPLMSIPAGFVAITCSMASICAGTFQSVGPTMLTFTPRAFPHALNAAWSWVTNNGKLVAVVTMTYSSSALASVMA